MRKHGLLSVFILLILTACDYDGSRVRTTLSLTSTTRHSSPSTSATIQDFLVSFHLTKSSLSSVGPGLAQGGRRALSRNLGL